MKDLPRLRDERGSALEHALLGAGSSPVASDETRAKTMAALGLAGSATLLAGAAAASGPLTSLAKLGWAKLIVGVSVVGAAAAVPAGLYYARHHAPAHLAQAAAVRDVAASTVAVATPVVAVPSEDPAEARPTAAAVAPHPARAKATLVHELAALDAARATLVAGDARSALALLDIYDDRFPRGNLELEAEVLRIDALSKSGRRGAARQRAEAFLRRHPQSVLAARVRADAHLGD
jgi:hypothetical protein